MSDHDYPITLVKQSDGSYSEVYADVVWTYTSYSEYPCTLDHSEEMDPDWCEGPHADLCVVCDHEIVDMWHFVCLDGGEAAHADCVTVIN